MDGDSTAKTFDSGANSAIKTMNDTDGIHEASHQTAPAGEKTTGTGTPVFNKDGAIGSMFKADGAIGGTAEKIGGPLSKDGGIGWVECFPSSVDNNVCSEFLPSDGERRSDRKDVGEGIEGKGNGFEDAVFGSVKRRSLNTGVRMRGGPLSSPPPSPAGRMTTRSAARTITVNVEPLSPPPSQLPAPPPPPPSHQPQQANPYPIHAPIPTSLAPRGPPLTIPMPPADLACFPPLSVPPHRHLVPGPPPSYPAPAPPLLLAPQPQRFIPASYTNPPDPVVLHEKLLHIGKTRALHSEVAGGVGGAGGGVDGVATQDFAPPMPVFSAAIHPSSMPRTNINTILAPAPPTTLTLPSSRKASISQAPPPVPTLVHEDSGVGMEVDDGKLISLKDVEMKVKETGKEGVLPVNMFVEELLDGMPNVG